MNIIERLWVYTKEYFVELWSYIVEYKTRILSGLILIVILIPAISTPPKDKNIIEAAQQGSRNLGSNLPIIGELPAFSLPNFSVPDLTPRESLVNIDLTQNYNNGKLEPRNSPLVDGVITNIDRITDIERVKSELKSAVKVRYEGKVSWEDNLKNTVYSDKFNANSSIKITYKDKAILKNIDEKAIMKDDNILLVSRAVFEEIGGDPKTEKSINVVIEQ